MRGRLSVLIAVLLLAGCAGASAGRGGAERPVDFHDIPIVSVDGQAQSLSELLRHRPALVSFWAPWCEPCLKELADLERLSRAMQPCGAGVFGIAVGEAPADIAAFTRARSLTYPQFTDREFQLADALGRRRIPTTLVFDADGQVVFVGDAVDQRAVAALTRAVGAAADDSFPSGSSCRVQ